MSVLDLAGGERCAGDMTRLRQSLIGRNIITLVGHLAEDLEGFCIGSKEAIVTHRNLLLAVKPKLVRR